MRYEDLEIMEALPHALYRPEGGEAILTGMRGARMVRIGSVDQDEIEGGGLIIDYCRIGESRVRRTVFAFNEIGLWVEWDGVLPTVGNVQE
jgi:hypothetical protein